MEVLYCTSGESHRGKQIVLKDLVAKVSCTLLLMLCSSLHCNGPLSATNIPIVLRGPLAPGLSFSFGATNQYQFHSSCHQSVGFSQPKTTAADLGAACQLCCHFFRGDFRCPTSAVTCTTLASPLS
jgi:hypothetical protein